MENLVIREPTEDELKRVVNITNQAFNTPYKLDGFVGNYNEPAEPFLKKVSDGELHVLAALFGDKIVGAVRYKFIDNTGDLWLEKLAVLPEYRKRGIASVLMTQVEEIAKDHNCKEIMLEAMTEKGLPEYYKRKGFKTIRVIENHGHHDEIMTKSL